MRVLKVDDREEDLAAVGPPPELQWQEQPLQSTSVNQGEELQLKP
jgi:hypothetical protein